MVGYENTLEATLVTLDHPRRDIAMANMTGQVGIAGYRSFISQELELQLDSRGKRVFPLSKAALGIDNLAGMDCVYLVLGRARPGPDEEAAEREQLAQFLVNPRRPRRAVYLSSMRLTESKLECERMVQESGRGRVHSDSRVVVLRPPAVFGPRQDIGSEMLIPSMVREGAGFEPKWPGRLTHFVSVRDLASHLASFADPAWMDFHFAGEPGSIFEIPGSFVATPHQIQGLYRAFTGLEEQRCRARRRSERAR